MAISWVKVLEPDLAMVPRFKIISSLARRVHANTSKSRVRRGEGKSERVRIRVGGVTLWLVLGFLGLG